MNHRFFNNQLLKCKIYKINEVFQVIYNVKIYKINSKSFRLLFLATTTLHNHSIISKPLINTSVLSPSHTTVSVQPNTSIVQSSFLNGGVSRADVPYRSLAQFGVLSKYNKKNILFSICLFYSFEGFKHKCLTYLIHIHLLVR